MTGHASVNRRIWAIDSEFIIPDPEQSRREGRIQTVQFACTETKAERVIISNLEPDNHKANTWVLLSQRELRNFLHSKRRQLKTCYGYVALCDIGSILRWLGVEKYGNRVTERGSQVQARIRYRGCDLRIYDTQSLLKGFGFNKLADCGKYLGIQKLPKPEWLGTRDPDTEEERIQFIRYAANDAAITARIVAWLIQEQHADPKDNVSSGTLVKREFNFPKRLQVHPDNRRVCLVPKVEELIYRSTCAGRSECFVNGYTRNVYYNDVKSLYPVSIVATNALLVDHVETVPRTDYQHYIKAIPDGLKLTETISEGNLTVAWMKATVRVDPNTSDAWSLPIRGYCEGHTRNFYMTGYINGVYSTFDLAAAKAEVLSVEQMWRPVYRKDTDGSMKKFTNILLDRLDNSVNKPTKARTKALTNSTYGKLGQSKPLSRTTNYPAYSIILGHSHLIMATLLSRYPTAPLGMDTDSIFGTANIAGKKFELSNGEDSLPVIMDTKPEEWNGEAADLAAFRSKLYILKNPNRPEEFGLNPVYAAHAWRYSVEDYIKLFEGQLTNLDTIEEVKRTLHTRNQDARTYIATLGHWYDRPVKLTEPEIQRLLRCDPKRQRAVRLSYQLVRERKNCPSRAWNLNEYLDTLGTDDPLGLLRYLT